MLQGELYPIPSSVDTVIPKPTKPYVTLDIANLQAFCERCVYFEMQSIWVCILCMCCDWELSKKCLVQSMKVKYTAANSFRDIRVRNRD